jgi:hypothetical protein
MAQPVEGELYRHFKGGLYKIVAIAQHTETEEGMVIYRSEEDPSKVWARPMVSFMSPVDTVKYPDAKQDMRFVKVTEDEAKAGPANDDKKVSSFASDPLGDKLDPEVEEFLDAKTAHDRLNILASLNHRLTDDMLVIMSTACGVELPEGDIRQKYLSLRDSLIIMGKYEGNRLRK